MSIDSDSDDDLPIFELIKKRKRLELLKSGKPENKNKNNDVIKPEKVTRSERVSADRGNGSKGNSSSSSSSSAKSSSSYVNVAAEFYDTTKKGVLLQKLLCRWWYAIEWPKLEEIPSPPLGYEQLDGFPGVFISTRVDSLGHILDLRNKDTCPSFSNMRKMDSAKIKELCVLAYTKQMEQLIDVEGSTVQLLRTLKSELREIQAIDPMKADREASKFQFK